MTTVSFLRTCSMILLLALTGCSAIPTNGPSNRICHQCWLRMNSCAYEKMANQIIREVYFSDYSLSPAGRMGPHGTARRAERWELTP